MFCTIPICQMFTYQILTSKLQPQPKSKIAVFLFLFILKNNVKRMVPDFWRKNKSNKIFWKSWTMPTPVEVHPENIGDILATQEPMFY